MDKLFKYGFVAVTVALALLYLIYDRKNSGLKKTIAQLQTQLLVQKLEKIEARVAESELTYEQALKEYEALKQRYGSLLDKYQLRSPGLEKRQ